MKQLLKISITFIIIISITIYVAYRVREYNRVYNPTKDMSSLETIDFYFDIEISDKKLIKEEYVNNGCIAYKIDVSSLTSANISSLTQGYNEYQYEEYNWPEGGNPFDDVAGVDWWLLNKDIVKNPLKKLLLLKEIQVQNRRCINCFLLMRKRKNICICYIWVSFIN